MEWISEFKNNDATIERICIFSEKFMKESEIIIEGNDIDEIDELLYELNSKIVKGKFCLKNGLLYKINKDNLNSDITESIQKISIDNRGEFLNYGLTLGEKEKYVLCISYKYTINKMFHGNKHVSNYEDISYKRRQIDTKASRKKPIEKINEVLENYQSERKHNFFKESCVLREYISKQKIKSEMRERDFRNDLEIYLNNNVSGIVTREYNTNTDNDLERTDIAILTPEEEILLIEVKYVLENKYINGEKGYKNNYKLPKRAKEGITQLITYCNSSIKDDKNVRYCVLAMFIADKDEELKKCDEHMNWEESKKIGAMFRGIHFLKIQEWKSFKE